MGLFDREGLFRVEILSKVRERLEKRKNGDTYTCGARTFNLANIAVPAEGYFTAHDAPYPYYFSLCSAVNVTCQTSPVTSPAAIQHWGPGQPPVIDVGCASLGDYSEGSGAFNKSALLLRYAGGDGGRYVNIVIGCSPAMTAPVVTDAGNLGYTIAFSHPEICDAPPPPAPTPSNATCGGRSLVPGACLGGADIFNGTAGVDACCALCTNYPNCKGFTVEYGVCHLKDSLVQQQARPTCTTGLVNTSCGADCHYDSPWRTGGCQPDEVQLDVPAGPRSSGRVCAARCTDSGFCPFDTPGTTGTQPGPSPVCMLADNVLLDAGSGDYSPGRRCALQCTDDTQCNPGSGGKCSTGFAPRNFCFYPEQAPLKSPWQKMAKRIAAVHAKHSLLDDRVASVLDLLDEA